MLLKLVPPVMDLEGMSTVDEGRPVNHHLAIHIFDKSTGARETHLLPTFVIMDQATGVSRQIASRPSSIFTLACLETQHLGPDGLHYGDNLFLSNGTYTVTVTVGDESAVWENMVVGAGAA